MTAVSVADGNGTQSKKSTWTSLFQPAMYAAFSGDLF